MFQLVEFTATDGTISEQDYEDKIKETFRQLGIGVEE
jgi:2-hydroxy-3-keto-5-methylthiopentenyl-1-phosphate phosphatase